ncbi:MAG: VWA domain-containing protein [Myxococcota bacterium]|nr:VWA domain-containing protein [Myxococcota bacterium]
MTGFEFRDPAFLLLIGLVPWVYWLARRSPSSVRFSSLSLVSGTPGSWRIRLLPLPALCLALATGLLAIALAGPRVGDAETRVFREGIALMLVVDRSGSMNARDFVEGDSSIDRLEAVKRVLDRFLGLDGDSSGRPDDLIGLVSFARYADSSAPLTLDHRNLGAILGQTGIVTEPQEDGTAVGEGLALAVERLRRNDAQSKVAILLTDGVSNAGDISPGQAAELAAAHDIKVYTVGAGRTGYAPVPVDWRGRQVLRQAFVELDERTLQSIAERTGGRYFHADNLDQLSEIYDEIDSLERSKIVELRYMQYDEYYARFALAAGISIAIAALLAGSLLRRLP